jgi:hypothetical protein
MGTATQFTKQTLSYTFTITNVISGQNYKLTANIYKRTASNNGSGTPARGAWALDSTQVITFNPSGTSYTTGSYNLPNNIGYEYQIQYAFCEFA